MRDGTRSGDDPIERREGEVERGRARAPERALISAGDLEPAPACGLRLADPDTVFTAPTLVQVWGRSPARA